MQSAAVEREVQSTGTLGSASFGISPEEAAHIMGILRSTLYSRKALAVLREYASNAWDEHRQCGKADVPIFVQLPSVMRPTLKIRDYGRGLSEHDVFHIYTQYGRSTKRDTNQAVGMLGIGSKAGFAYTDSFTVTSWHQGTKSVYNAVLDKSNKGEMRKMFEEPCGDESGIEIMVAVRPKDVDEFIREARPLFRYFDPQPRINLALDSLPQGMTQGFITETRQYSGTREWIAVMGCIPYRLDLDQIKEGLTEVGLWDALGHLSGGLYLPVGAVEFSASREELQYTEKTVAVLVAQFQKLTQEYTDDALAALDKPDVPGWNRRMKATFLHSVLKLPLPKDYRVWTEPSVNLFTEKTPPKTFVLHDPHSSWSSTSRIPVQQSTHILLCNDTVRSLKGWQTNYYCDRVAVPIAPATLDDVRAEIETLAKAVMLEGLPISLLTARATWQAPRKSNGRRQYPPNQKHKDRTFLLAEKFQDDSPRSQYWESAAPPEVDHVYVIISEFRPATGPGLAEMRNDRILLKQCGVVWPTIYGYKTTMTRPVTDQDIEKGTPYATWRTKTFEALIADKVKDDLRDLAWSDLFRATDDQYDSKYRWHPFSGYVPELVQKMTADLGAKHPFTRYFAKHLEARAAVQKFPRGRRELVQSIAKAAGYTNKRSPTVEWLLRLHKAYPMMTVVAKSDSQMSVWRTHYDILVAYIKDQDRKVGSIESPEA